MRRRNIPTRQRKRFTIASFEAGADVTDDPLVTGGERTTVCYNFDTSGGSLKELSGLEKQSMLFPMERVSAIACGEKYEEWRGTTVYYPVCLNGIGALVYQELCEDGSLSSPMAAGPPYLTGEQTIVPYMLNGEQALLFCSKSHGLAYWRVGQPYPTVVENSPRITSMAIHAERLFVTVDGRADTVWFSDDLDPTNWEISLDGAGFIRLSGERGNCEKVVSFGGCLYVFRSFGITRITAYADQTEFVVTDLFTSGGKICADSVTVCGNRILFLSSDGLFSFDGETATRVCAGVAPILEQTGLERAAFWKGKYYLATGSKPNGVSARMGNDTLFVYDVYTKKSNMYYGIDVRGLFCLTAIDRFYLVLSDGRPYEMSAQSGVDGEALPRKWMSNSSALGSNGRKLLQSVCFFLDGECDLTVTCDGKTRAYYDLRGDGGLVSVSVNLSGKAFSLAITSNAPRCVVTRLSVDYA